MVTPKTGYTIEELVGLLTPLFINSITNILKNHQCEALIAQQKNYPELKPLTKNSNSAEADIKLKLINDLFCIEENNNLRIYVPHPLRNILLDDLHNTAHPDVRNTLREAQQRYYWPFMHRDVTNWTKACPRCQAAKITRHNTAPPVMLPSASEKFRYIHFDVVGPLL